MPENPPRQAADLAYYDEYFRDHVDLNEHQGEPITVERVLLCTRGRKQYLMCWGTLGERRVHFTIGSTVPDEGAVAFLLRCQSEKAFPVICRFRKPGHGRVWTVER